MRVASCISAFECLYDYMLRVGPKGRVNVSLSGLGVLVGV